jgi:hypothetical protein
LNIGERVENAYANNEAAVGIGAHVAWYIENPDPSVPPFNGRDGFVLRVVGTANTRKGIWYKTEYFYSHYFPSKPELEHELEFSDNYGGWATLPLSISLYGGPGLQNRSQYPPNSNIWVSKNGFLCFEGECGDLGPPL